MACAPYYVFVEFRVCTVPGRCMRVSFGVWRESSDGYSSARRRYCCGRGEGKV